MAESADECQEKDLARRREFDKRLEAKAKKRAYRIEYLKRPEVKEHRIAYSREYYLRQGVKAKKLAYQKERLKRPEVRARVLELKEKYRSQPEKRSLQRWYDEQYRKRKPSWNQKSMRRFRQKRSKWLADLRAKSPCSICGRSFPDHPSVIEFHHKSRESKEMRLSQMRLRPMSEVKAELDKCVPVCANCHRIIHYRQRRRDRKTTVNEVAKNRQQWYLNMKSALACSICGQTFPDYPSVIEFHHKGDSKKESSISAMVRDVATSLSQLQAEIDKCIVVCANCHRVVHDIQRRKKRRSVDVDRIVSRCTQSAEVWNDGSG